MQPIRATQSAFLSRHNTRRRFLHDASGASTGEYAVIVALIAIVGLLALEGLNAANSRSFTTVAHSMTASPEDADGLAPRDVDPAQAVAPPEPSWMEPYMRAVRASLFACILIALVVSWRQNSAHSQGRTLAPPPEYAPSTVTHVERHARFVEKRQQILSVLGRDVFTILESRISVRQVMTDDVARTRPKTSVDEVRRLMAECDIQHVMVCDRRGQLLGVVSDRDIRAGRGATAEAVMADHPHMVRSDAPVAMAATIMFEHHVHCLPVVDDGVLRGVVTMTDLALTLQCMITLLEREKADLLAGHELLKNSGALDPPKHEPAEACEV